MSRCKRKGLLESVGPAGYNAMSANIATLCDAFTSVERLSSVGIPTVYGIHLKQCVSLFLFTLPFVSIPSRLRRFVVAADRVHLLERFTLVEIMGWKMVRFDLLRLSRSIAIRPNICLHRSLSSLSAPSRYAPLLLQATLTLATDLRRRHNLDVHAAHGYRGNRFRD